MTALLKRHYRRAEAFLREQIWKHDISEMPRFQAFVFRQLRVGVIFVRGLSQSRIQLRASAMTFTTLLTLAPVLVITLSLLQVFGALRGLETRLEGFIVENLSPGSQEEVRAWLYRFLASIRGGAYQGLTLIFFTGGVLALLGSIEQAFNEIWGIHRGRSLFQRFSTYTTLIVFGPLLIGLSLSLTASLETSALLRWIDQLSPEMRALSNVGFKLIPILLTGMALTLLYTVMPNVRVSLRASLPAGLVSGILWELSKIAYTTYVRNASHYGTLYGSVAAIPLFLIWVYVSWLVVLFGAQLAFARDAAHDFRMEEVAIRASLRERLRVALHVALATAQNYREERNPPALVALAHRLRLSLRLVHRVAETLVEGGLFHFVTTPREEPGLVPARSPDRISVYDVIVCLADRGWSEPTGTVDGEPAFSVDNLMQELDRNLRERWEHLSLADILDAQGTATGRDVLTFPEIRARRLRRSRGGGKERK